MAKVMKASLTRVGNQLCLPLPDEIATKLGWADGIDVFLHDAGALGLWLVSEDMTEQLAELGLLAQRLTTGAAEAHASVERAVRAAPQGPDRQRPPGKRPGAR
jgi:hypothetical protein